MKKGEPLLEIETDKVNLDLEAEEDGVLGEIVVGDGATAEVGATLSTIGGKGAAAPAKPQREKEPAASKSETKPAAPRPGARSQARAGTRRRRDHAAR